MANCSDTKCRCVVRAGEGVEVTGSGSVHNPYIVNLLPAGQVLRVQDSSTIDMILTGAGTLANPLTLTAHVVGGGGAGGWYLDDDVLVFPEGS